MTLPDWLNRMLVQRALQINTYSDIRVTTLIMRTFEDTTDFYNSNLSRIIANTTEGQKVLIAKTMPTSTEAKKLVREARMFRREATMYGSIIPELHEMLAGRRGIDGELILLSPFTPAHIYNGRRPRKYILLEDLTGSGFRRVDRYEGLDFRHAVLALRTLAVFHAASAAFLKDCRIAIQKLENPYLLTKWFIRCQVQQTFRRVALKCREMENFRSFADAIEELTPSTTTKLIECHGHKGAKFNVICHGDFRIDNMMFKYEDGEVREIRFLDFQMSHVTSPAADLLLFLSTSLNKHVYKAHRNVLIQEYHDSLRNTLLAFDLRPPTFGRLGEILHANSLIAVYSCIAIAPLLRASIPQEEEAAIHGGNYQDCTLYDVDDVKEWIRILLEDMAGLKWINVLGFRKVRWESDTYGT